MRLMRALSNPEPSLRGQLEAAQTHRQPDPHAGLHLATRVYTAARHADIWVHDPTLEAEAGALAGLRSAQADEPPSIVHDWLRRAKRAVPVSQTESPAAARVHSMTARALALRALQTRLKLTTHTPVDVPETEAQAALAFGSANEILAALRARGQPYRRLEAINRSNQTTHQAVATTAPAPELHQHLQALHHGIDLALAGQDEASWTEHATLIARQSLYDTLNTALNVSRIAPVDSGVQQQRLRLAHWVLNSPYPST